MDQDAGVVEDMLSRVHCKAGPRADIDIAVVQVMHVFEKPRDVDQAVNPVKVERLPEPDHEEKQDEPDRRC